MTLYKMSYKAFLGSTKVHPGGCSGPLCIPPPHYIECCINCNVWSLRPPCSEVLCLGIVTFEQGVACLTGSYSMAVRPIEEHPCVLRGKGTQIKYATMWLRAQFHAKPNISPFSAKDKLWYHIQWVWTHLQSFLNSNVYLRWEWNVFYCV